MGITGLIPFLEKASIPVSIKELKGCSVAVDSYCWLHRGVFCCADKLLQGVGTDYYVHYCIKYVDMLLDAKMKVIMVFDGCHLPAKAETEKRRREIRRDSKKLAMEYLRNNEIDKARSYMKRAIDVTHEMAVCLMKACRLRSVDCIVAPYEADAQMAWLNKIGLADYIITEDSDLTLFGATKILFKLDLNGNGLLIESNKLHLAMGCKPEKYTFDKFRRMCILSGCDYLDSLPGIGLKKACKFMLMTEEDNMWVCLRKLPKYLNMKKLEVTDEYIENFCKAEATFKHMYIYNPIDRKMQRLYDLDELTTIATEERYCSNAGTKFLDEEQAFQLALGNLNPFTLQKVDYWNPDIDNGSHNSSNNFSNIQMKRQMTSIWLKDGNKFSNQQQFAVTKLNKKNSLESMFIIQQSQNDVNNENCNKLQEDEICNLYATAQLNENTQYKRKVGQSDKEELKGCDTMKEMNTLKCNPFSKINTNYLTNQTDEMNSPKKKRKDNSISKIEIKSRFFEQNQKLLKTSIDKQSMLQEVENFEKQRQILIKNQQHLYQKSPIKFKQSSTDNEELDLKHQVDTNSSENSKELFNTSNVSIKDEELSNTTNENRNTDTVIEVIESIRTTQAVSPDSSFNKKIGLSIPRKHQNNPLSRIAKKERETKQSTLAMFGFQKRPQLKL